jgi:uncharacterized protein (TIGR02284 family)
MTHDKLHDDINALHKTLQDSRDGYHECAESVKEQDLKNKFQKLVDKRETMLTALRREAQALGESTETSGSTLAAAHRIWVDIKSFFTGNDKEAIINEIDRGENFLINRYEEILKHDEIPATLRQLLEQQKQEVRNDLIQVKTFYTL